MSDLKALHFDAFSSGQISSKLWLCEELEKAGRDLKLSPSVLWILGGWYAMAGFLLLSRGHLNLRQVRSFDCDPACEPIADLIHENWVWQDWKFKAFTADCHNLRFSEGQYGPSPDIVINSSIEHMQSTDWWEQIPPDKLVALQTCNMVHDDHHHTSESVDQLIKQFPLTTLLYKGEQTFKYPKWQFTRFMTIGKK